MNYVLWTTFLWYFYVAPLLTTASLLVYSSAFMFHTRTEITLLWKYLRVRIYFWEKLKDLEAFFFFGVNIKNFLIVWDCLKQTFKQNFSFRALICTNGALIRWSESDAEWNAQILPAFPSSPVSEAGWVGGGHVVERIDTWPRQS